MKTKHWIFIGFLLGIGILYLHWANMRDEAMFKMHDSCVYVEDINGVTHCTDN
jgi:hypothetical protein